MGSLIGLLIVVIMGVIIATISLQHDAAILGGDGIETIGNNGIQTTEDTSSRKGISSINKAQEAKDLIELRDRETLDEIK